MDQAGTLQLLAKEVSTIHSGNINQIVVRDYLLLNFRGHAYIYKFSQFEKIAQHLLNQQCVSQNLQRQYYQMESNLQRFSYNLDSQLFKFHTNPKKYSRISSVPQLVDQHLAQEINRFRYVPFFRSNNFNTVSILEEVFQHFLLMKPETQQSLLLQTCLGQPTDNHSFVVSVPEFYKRATKGFQVFQDATTETAQGLVPTWKVVTAQRKLFMGFFGLLAFDIETLTINNTEGVGN